MLTRAGVVLSLLLLAQLGFHARANAPSLEVVPIDPERPLPFRIAESNAARWPTGSYSRPSCRSAFICTVKCPACKRLADSIASNQARVPPHLMPLWLVPDDSASVRAWGRARGLPDSLVVPLAPFYERRWMGSITRVGDVWFTPLRVILTEDFLVRDVWPSDQIPDEDQFKQLCFDERLMR